MKNENLKSLVQKTLLVGALTITAGDLTPGSWQAHADHHEENTEKAADGEMKKAESKGEAHACGEGKCGNKKDKGSEGSCGEGSCGDKKKEAK
ncbi:hypothetical protein N9N67_03155 [Bacteriovoracaceae bacterium]|nr:hypothetical protein [Bacteriovoracaceae bacterium]